jgi:hypothetical protein
MCLSAEAFALFLAVLSPEIVEAGEGRVTINGSAERTVWTRVAETWCLLDPAETEAGIAL